MMKGGRTLLAGVLAANLVVALWPPRRAEPRSPRVATASPPAPAGQARARNSPTAPRLATTAAETCRQATAEIQSRVASYRSLLSRSWIMSEHFPALAPNQARSAEVKQAVSQVLGRPLPEANLDCRGPQGQVCNVKGLSHEENMSLQGVGQLDWGLTTLASMELGGRDGVFIKLRPPGYQPGRPVLERFIALFRSEGRAGSCSGQEPGTGALRITLAIPQDPAEAGDPEEAPGWSAPASPEAAPGIRVQNAEARVLTSYEQCLLDQISLLAASYPVPEHTAPATLVGVRFGAEGQPRL